VGVWMVEGGDAAAAAAAAAAATAAAATAAASPSHSPNGLIVDSTAAINPSSHPAPHSKPGNAATCQCICGMFPRFFATAKGRRMQGRELKATPEGGRGGREGGRDG